MMFVGEIIRTSREAQQISQEPRVDIGAYCRFNGVQRR